MAQLVIPLKDDALKTEIAEAFVDAYANPDVFSPENLVILHTSNFIRDVLNKKREKDAVQAALDAVEKESSLT
jgi:hypothetical protein